MLIQLFFRPLPQHVPVSGMGVWVEEHFDRPPAGSCSVSRPCSLMELGSVWLTVLLYGGSKSRRCQQKPASLVTGAADNLVCDLRDLAEAAAHG